MRISRNEKRERKLEAEMKRENENANKRLKNADK